MAWNEQTATQYGINSGLLQQGETATGGLLQQRANAAGVNLTPTIQSANTPSAPASYNGGVVPLNVVPLNQWQQTGLTRAAVGVNPNTVQRDPYAEAMLGRTGGMYDTAAGMIQGASGQITPEDIARFVNPHEQAVVDSSMAGLSRQAEEMKAQLLKNAGQRGAAGFGSTMTANPLSALNRDVLETGGALESKLRSEGFNTALSGAFKERGLMQTGGSQLAQIASGLGSAATNAQSIGMSAAGLQQANIADQLEAGNVLRDFHQGQADVAFGDYLAGQNYPITQAQISTSLIPSLTGQVENQTYYQPSGTSTMLGKIASGAGVIGGFLN